MIACLFTVLISLPALAADGVNQAIEQAQSLALKKNRQEACAILQKTLATTPAPLKSRGKLVESINHLSKVFFTDKGQKAFESGQASLWETPDLALAQFRAALENEDNNIQILSYMARIQIMQNDCDGALMNLLKARNLNPYLAEIAVLELRAHLCQGNSTLMREKVRALPALDKWESAYVQYLMAKDAMDAKTSRKALESLLKVIEEQPGFPEAYYALSRAGIDLERDVEPWLQKYVSLCKAVGVRERRRYSLEPRLCVNLKEAENELAKKSTVEN
jgi:tetratricopeptide (TPR) repeat protein